MRTVLIAMLALCIAFVPAVTFAQSDGVYCGDVDDQVPGSCDLLIAAAENDKEVVDGAYDIEFDLLLSNIPDAPFDELQLTWLQTGVYTSNSDLREELLADIDVTSADELQDPATMMALIDAFLSTSNTQQDITLLLSDAIVDAISEESDFPVPSQIDLSFAIIDGIIYIDLSTIAEYIPQAGMLGGWVGTELAPFLELGLEQAAADPDAQAALMAMGGAMAMAMSSEGQAAMEEAQAAQLEMVSDYLTIERLEDEELEDEDAAVFLTTFDLAGFASSPEFMDMAMQQMAMMEAMGQDVPSEEELAEMEEMMPMIAPVLFEDFLYDTYQLVGLDSELTRVTAVDLVWDMTGLMEMAAESGQDVPDEAPLFDMVMIVDSYAQNEIGEIVAPAGALVLPAAMIMGMME